MSFYTNQSQAYVLGNASNNQPDLVWYVVTHPGRSDTNFTIWEEMLVYMGATTFDSYYIQKGLEGIVSESYAEALDQANSGLQTQLKSLGGNAFYVLTSPAEADAIKADWA